MKNMMEVRGICKDFGRFKLDNVSFSVPEGYIMGLIGPNGAGKTTTISLILNTLKRDAGEIEVFGKDNIKHEVEIKQNLGIVFDTSMFVEDWTVLDAGKSMALFYTTWDQAKFLHLIESYQLDPKKKVKELSRGMQTKLMLACALSHEAKLLILDEPTSGMDPLARDELLDLLREYIQDGTRSVLFSTHITSDLERAADFITYIRDGKVFFTGTTDELIESYRLIKGGQEELTRELREKIHGLRTHSTGFEGLVHTADVPAAPGGCVLDSVSIDEIMVYTAKEDS